MSDFVSLLTIVGAVSALGSIISLLIGYMRRKPSTSIVTLRSEEHSVRINKEDAGFVDAILSGSSEVKSTLKELFKKEMRCIDIADISLKWLFDSGIQEALVSALRRGVHMRIIIAHPLSAGLREAQENRRAGDIAYEALSALRQLIELRSECCPSSNQLEIRITLAVMSFFAFATSTRIIIKPYMASAYSAPGYLLEFKSGDERFQKFYHETFEYLWENASVTAGIATDAKTAKAQVEELRLLIREQGT